MTVMQKLKFMQEITFATIVECLQSNLLAKLPMHDRARAKHAKTCKCRTKRGLQVQSSGNLSPHDAHIRHQFIGIYHISEFSKSLKSQRNKKNVKIFCLLSMSGQKEK